MSKKQVNVSITIADEYSGPFPDEEISMLVAACARVHQKLPVELGEAVEAFRVRPEQGHTGRRWRVETILIVPGSEARKLTAATAIFSGAGDDYQRWDHDALSSRILEKMRMTLAEDLRDLAQDVKGREGMITEIDTLLNQ